MAASYSYSICQFCPMPFMKALDCQLHMSKYHLRNVEGKADQYFCQFCPLFFKNRKNRAYHMHSKHELDLKVAVEASYAGISATWTPPIEQPSLGWSLAGQDVNDGFHTPTTPQLVESSMTSPPVDRSMSMDSPITFDLPDSDQLVELTWSGETSTSGPLIRFVQEQEPQDFLVNTPAVPILPLQVLEPSESEQTWWPTLHNWPNQPSWVTQRNISLQKLLDSAAPLFADGADIGTPMCEVCTDHFANLKLDVDSNWTQPELSAKRAKTHDASENQVGLSD